ncbi:MAG: putative aminohydrolase SsnA [bacterium]|nr:putative aminohydrolase SsnA [bacterium]
MAPKTRDMLIGNGTVVTLGGSNKVIHDGAVWVRGGAVEAVGKTAAIRKKAAGAEFVDARGMIVMPGFINAHMHLYSTFARGLSPKGRPPANFVQILERLWWPLDRALREEDILYSALVPLIDCIRGGTTTILDHHESQDAQRGCLDPLEEALRRTGVRGCLCLGVSDRYGKGREGIEENVRFAGRIRARRERGDDLVAAMFGLHALFTVGEETLAESVAAAGDLGVGIHLHVAEDAADQALNEKRYSQRVVRRLNRAGALGPRSLAVHCVHVNDAEMDLLRNTETPAVHNPQSNMNNAVGVAPVIRMLSKGVLVGLGTDGMTANMRDEVRVANILHKLAARDPRVFFAESCRLLLEHNAAIAGRHFARPLGVLKKGAHADIILVDYDPPTPLNEATFLGHFLFGICGARVDTTIVGGRVLMRGGEILAVDEEKVHARSRALAAAFWRRF